MPACPSLAWRFTVPLSFQVCTLEWTLLHARDQGLQEEQGSST